MKTPQLEKQLEFLKNEKIVTNQLKKTKRTKSKK